jgi:murein DD-endopeptidase MepM/ murein hydrolase activator NlpD
MTNPSPLAIGDNVPTGSIVGKMGDTGNAFGVHLHLEYSSVSYWDTTRTKFFNPLTELGIPNERGTIVHYNGTTPPEPPTPTPTAKKRRFPWVLYANKLRRRNLRK